jgi:signal transduction histidine kinase
VLGWTRILRSYEAGAQVEQAVEIIERNARAQARLIDDLLDLSRIITGKIRLQVEPVDVAAVATDSIQSVRPAADAKRIALGMQIAELPPATADPQRLQQVFWNLLSNAVKFTSPGGRVTLSLAATADAIEAHVADTGIGIPADVLSYVFDRFVQGRFVEHLHALGPGPGDRPPPDRAARRHGARGEPGAGPRRDVRLHPAAAALARSSSVVHRHFSLQHGVSDCPLHSNVAFC